MKLKVKIFVMGSNEMVTSKTLLFTHSFDVVGGPTEECHRNSGKPSGEASCLKYNLAKVIRVLGPQRMIKY